MGRPVVTWVQRSQKCQKRMNMVCLDWEQPLKQYITPIKRYINAINARLDRDPSLKKIFTISSSWICIWRSPKLYQKGKYVDYGRLWVNSDREQHHVWEVRELNTNQRNAELSWNRFRRLQDWVHGRVLRINQWNKIWELESSALVGLILENLNFARYSELVKKVVRRNYW